LTVTASLPSPAPARRRSGRRLAGERRRAGYLFVSAYICLLLLFGVLPTAYALYLSVTKPGSKWAGFHNFVATGHDYRFLPAFEHIAVYLTV
jgi:multiple sugar transport system permease protein